jgi:hypothetical protein
MDTVQETYGPYYEAKGREIPRTSSLQDEEARKLWDDMAHVAHYVTYTDNSESAYRKLDEAVTKLANHPGCDWTDKLIYYWIRQHYWK